MSLTFAFDDEVTVNVRVALSYVQPAVKASNVTVSVGLLCSLPYYVEKENESKRMNIYLTCLELNMDHMLLS